MSRLLRLFFEERPLVYYGKENNEIKERVTYVASPLFPNKEIERQVLDTIKEPVPSK